jgi:hypothetical protein
MCKLKAIRCPLYKARRSLAFVPPPAILCYHGHILMENRSGLVVGAVVSHADGFAERASALRLLDCVPGGHAKTVGADKAYDTRDFVNDCRARNVIPHVARNDERWGGSAIDGRTSRHAGYRISQIIRKRIEKHFKLTMVASNLTRMAECQGWCRKERRGEPPWREGCTPQGLHACACPAKIARQTGNSARNRTRKPPEHSFGRHDGALFNSLLDADGGLLPPHRLHQPPGHRGPAKGDYQCGKQYRLHRCFHISLPEYR